MSLFDLSNVVAMLATHTITITRYNPDTYGSNGKANPRTVATAHTAIPASITPVSLKLDRSDPQGVNFGQDLVNVITTISLAPRDRLTIPGMGEFEVESIENWNPVGNFCEAKARRPVPNFEPRA